MEVTYVDATKLKTLEEYALALASGMISLKTLEEYQKMAVKIGLIPEDMNCRANTMIWDLSRMMRLYHDQLEGTLELLPEDFDITETITLLKKQELTRARQMTRKKKEVKDETMDNI